MELGVTDSAGKKLDHYLVWLGVRYLKFVDDESLVVGGLNCRSALHIPSLRMILIPKDVV